MKILEKSNELAKQQKSKRDIQRRVNPAKQKLYQVPLESQNIEIRKQRMNAYDQLLSYYNIKIPIPISLHKIFIIIEIQVNASLTRAKVVPYMFLVKDLCRLGIVHVNGKIVANQFHILKLWDVLAIPVPLYDRMNTRLIRQQFYPKLLARVFKKYWKHITTFNRSKLWILSNSLTSSITAETTIFDYPNLLLYIGIFRRFTRLHYETRPYPANGKYRQIGETNTLLKLKTLSFLGFYHR